MVSGLASGQGLGLMVFQLYDLGLCGRLDDKYISNKDSKDAAHLPLFPATQPRV